MLHALFQPNSFVTAYRAFDCTLLICERKDGHLSARRAFSALQVCFFLHNLKFLHGASLEYPQNEIILNEITIRAFESFLPL